MSNPLYLKNFSLKDLKWGKILFDMIRGKLKIRSLKRLYNLYNSYDNLIVRKNIKIKYIKYLSFKDLKEAIELHNRYTTREDITIQSFAMALSDLATELKKYEAKYREIIVAIENLCVFLRRIGVIV